MMAFSHTHVNAKNQATEWARTILESSAVIVDFETTGLQDSEICQIGIVDMQGNALIDTFVKPSGRISPGATRVNGITDQMVMDAPAFTELYVKLSTVFAGKIAVAYNSAFDMGILKGECQRRKLPAPRTVRWDCAMKTYAKFYGQWNAQRRSYSWQSLIKACVQQEIRVKDAHSAIGDCLMTLELIKVMAR